MPKVVRRLVTEPIPADVKTNSFCCALPASDCLGHKQGRKTQLQHRIKSLKVSGTSNGRNQVVGDAIIYSHERVARKDINVINVFRFATYLPDNDFLFLTLFTFRHHPCGWAVEG